MGIIHLAIKSIFVINLVFLFKNIEAKDYTGSQIWRITTNGKTDDEIGIPKLQLKFDVWVWLHSENFTDIFVGRSALKDVAKFLKQQNFHFEIRIQNVQKAINDEKPTRRQGALSTGGSPIDWQNYHSFDDITKYLEYMQTTYPNLCKIITIGNTTNGRPLNVLRISANATDKRIIWIDGGIHAREGITPATVTYFIEELVTLWAQHPQHIRDATWYILPVLNPDGYEYSRNVDRLWRKNRRKTGKCIGVDLNRNFPYHFAGKGSSGDPCSDVYHGPKPFTEPESKALRDFLRGLSPTPKVFLTVHSPSQVLAYPFAYGQAVPANQRVLQRVGSLAVQNAAKITGTTYKILPTYKFTRAAGCSADWAKALIHIDLVYTLELRDRGHGFLLPPKLILPTAKEAFAMVKTFSNNAAIV